MKKIVHLQLVLLSVFFIACKNDSKANLKENTLAVSEQTTSGKPYITLNIEDGPIKGTYHFEKIKGKPRPSITMNYFDETTKNVSQRNTSSMSALGFSLPDDNFMLNNVVKLFKGAITIGEHEARRDSKKENEDCGSFMLTDRTNKHTWDKVIGVNISCNPLIIKTFSEWEKKSVGSKRFVSGTYTDMYELEFTQDNNSASTYVKTKVSLTFNAVQKAYD